MILYLTLFFPACHMTAHVKQPQTSHPTAVDTESEQPLPIIDSWKGRIHIHESHSHENTIPQTQLIVIRNNAELESFVARIPIHSIQRRKPAPKSTDPLLNDFTIDFEQHMLVIITRNENMYVYAPITRLVGTNTSMVVNYQLDSIGNTNQYASVLGMGTYTAVKTNKTTGHVTAEEETSER